MRGWVGDMVRARDWVRGEGWEIESGGVWVSRRVRRRGVGSRWVRVRGGSKLGGELW